MVRNSSSSTSSRGPIVVPGVHHWTGVPLFTGSRPGAPLSSSLTFSSSAHFPLSPLPTHNSCSPLVGQQLTAAMRTVLSVLVEGAWVPMGVLSVGRLPFESRASFSGRENQAAAQVQVGGGSERNESMELGGRSKVTRSCGQQIIFRSLDLRGH